MQMIYFLSGGLAGAILAVLLLKSRNVPRHEFATVNTALSVELDRTRSLTERVNAADCLVAEQAEKITSLTASLSSKSAVLESMEKRIAESEERFKLELDQKRKEVADISVQLTDKFEVIASRILDEKSGRFVEANKQNMETILTPLSKELTDFKRRVEDVYDKESKDRHLLVNKIDMMAESALRFSEQANNFANAITMNGKSQGDVGEMLLESYLEGSGLEKDRHYFLQNYLKNDNGDYLLSENGEKMRPDALVRFPDEREVIIDSKVSLTAFVKFNSAVDKNDEQKFLKEHLKSIYAHIDNLSSKRYQDHGASLDFVMMFIPFERAYLTAVQADTDLLAYANSRNVVLTTPSNLIVALRIILNAWTRDKQNKNFMEILERVGKLYDKFAAVMESFKDVGESLRSAQNSYNTAVNRLSNGRDNVFRQVDRLITLGAKAQKSIPQVEVLLLQDQTDEEE